jgi:hypothetical protein
MLRSGTFLLAVALAACAGTEGPPPSSVAVELATASTAQLRGARRVWIAGASSRTGDVASGMSRAATSAPASASAPAGTPPDGGAENDGAAAAGVDVREGLARAIRRVRGLELVDAREQTDLVLYYEQADRLRCYGCRQPEDLWYWWGVVADPAGHELASLHGETDDGADAAARQFAKSVKELTRRRPKGAAGGSR